MWLWIVQWTLYAYLIPTGVIGFCEKVRMGSLNFIIEEKVISGRFDPATHPDFVSFHTDGIDGVKYLRWEVYDAFAHMAEAAKKDSIHLYIVSATRTFDYQKELWEKKWTGKTKVDGKKLNKSITDPEKRALKIMEYTAPPGYSRHHWGTDIDLNSVEPEYFETKEGMAVYNWLKIHAGEYGFCQTYTELGAIRPKGFNEEKWHWSYGRLSDLLWMAQLDQHDIRKKYRFKGYKAVHNLPLMDYLKGINQCNQ